MINTTMHVGTVESVSDEKVGQNSIRIVTVRIACMGVRYKAGGVREPTTDHVIHKSFGKVCDDTAKFRAGQVVYIRGKAQARQNGQYWNTELIAGEVGVVEMPRAVEASAGPPVDDVPPALDDGDSVPF
jgi:hypothetical protein